MVTAALLAALMAALGGVTVARAAGSVQFAAPVYYPAGSYPQAIVSADFNHDGKPDLAAVNTSGVQILLNQGNGTFTAGNSYTGSYRAIAAGDLNGDGMNDLAVADEGNNDVAFFRGNGLGGFTSAQTISTGAGTSPFAVALADLGNTGLDIVTANLANNTISVIPNDGNPLNSTPFGTATTYPVGTSPVAVAAGDFNNDGKLDVVVANSGSNTISVLLGNGDGTLQAAKTYAVGPNPTGVAVGDFNGDGKLDIATANQTPTLSATVSVLLGNGDGTFQPAVNYAGGAGATSIGVADFNGDGRPDLVTVNNPGGDTSVLLGNGDGTFQPGLSEPGGNDFPSGLAVADFNGDGKPDLAVGSSDATTGVTVLLNTTAGKTSATTATVAVVGGTLSETAPKSPSVTAMLNGFDQSATYQALIEVVDATGTGAGWHLTLASTQFSTSGGTHTLPANASMMTGVTSACAASAACVLPGNKVGYPVAVPAGAAPAVAIFNATAGTGMGAANVTPTVSVFIPAGTYAGAYVSTLSLAVVAGP